MKAPSGWRQPINEGMRDYVPFLVVIDL